MEKIKSKEEMNTVAQQIYEAIGEGYGFNGSKQDAIKLIEKIIAANQFQEVSKISDEEKECEANHLNIDELLSNLLSKILEHSYYTDCQYGDEPLIQMSVMI